MIKAENIFKNYGDLQVLKGISLSVSAGEIVSIVGASGAGKTTLLHILGTLDSPSNPTENNTKIQLNNIEVSKMKDKALSKFRNENIGFIFQFHQLLPEFSAVENVCMPAMIMGKSFKELEKRGLELLDFLGLKNRAKHKPLQMSGGEQQRVAIARAFVNRPQILIADEPTGNLDPETSVGIMKLLDRINRADTTVIMATHDSSIVDQMRRRVLELRDGELVRDQIKGVYGVA